MMRLGLCCTFQDAPIKFRTTTAKYLGTLAGERRTTFLRDIAADNARALAASIDFCAAHGIGAFRVCNSLLPVATHPVVGYGMEDIDPHGEVRQLFVDASVLARRAGLRLSMHPDQFVVPGSPNDVAAANSRRELEHLAGLALLTGVEQLTLHGGGAQGGKPAAVERLRRGLDLLSPGARALVVLENDDRSFHVQDLLPACRADGIPLVYDAHHHRCLPDGLSIDEATDAAAETWGAREPWAHLSSPRGGWSGTDPRPHADYIDTDDVPRAWRGRTMTVDVEAKAKELAVARLQAWAGG